MTWNLLSGLPRSFLTTMAADMRAISATVIQTIFFNMGWTRTPERKGRLFEQGDADEEVLVGEGVGAGDGDGGTDGEEFEGRTVGDIRLGYDREAGGNVAFVDPGNEVGGLLDAIGDGTGRFTAKVRNGEVILKGLRLGVEQCYHPDDRDTGPRGRIRVGVGEQGV